MINNLYARACTEVSVILNYLPKDEYDKIPKEEVEFYLQNADKDYNFTIDTTKTIEEQNVSKKANAILVMLFKNYIATEVQKEKLNSILKNNFNIKQEELKQKYNKDNIFESEQKNYESITKVEELTVNTDLVEYKKSIIMIISEKIKMLIKRILK